jgi:hypothetical protein
MFLVPVSRRSFFVFLAATLAIFFIFSFLDQPLRTPASPNGIVSFELAGSLANARSMIDSWGERGRLFAAFGLGFDFLFMPVYALALSIGALLAAGKHSGTFARLGAWIARGAWIAAGFDAVENMALAQSLFNGAVDPFPSLAAICASVKFALIAIGIAYGLIGWLMRARPPARET